MLAHQGHPHHRGIPRHDPGVVRHEQRVAVRGHALDPLGVHAPPPVVHELEERQGGLRELLVVAPVVLVVAAAEPPDDRLEALPGVARQR